MSTGATIVLIIVVLAVLAAVGWFVWKQTRSRQLRNRFGSEYDRRLESADSRSAAERELLELRKRHDSLDLKALPAEARTRYLEQWALVQEQFIDRPGESVVEAESLVHSAMRDRGYPTDGFDQQLSDLSVAHGHAVGDYREAHGIRSRLDQSEVSTEDLRRALVHYRTIFGAVIGEEPKKSTVDTSVNSSVDDDRRYDDAAR